jgi:hypothetical protein
MTPYPTGSLVRNADTLAVALRTAFAEDSELGWGVMAVGHGGHFAGPAEVADWLDVASP